MSKSIKSSSRNMNTPDSLNKSYATPEIQMQRQRTLATLDIKSEEQVLDIGCGTGFLTLEIARAVGVDGRVEAIDQNKDMVAAAANRCAEMPQVKVNVGDVTNLKLQSGQFDAVTCTQVLLYVDDSRHAIAEMVRVLKPGGKLLILETDWRTAILHSNDPVTTDAVFRSWDQSVASPNLPVYLRKLMQQAGVKVNTVEPIPILNTQYDISNFSTSSLDWLSRVAVKHGALTAEQADSWKEDIAMLGKQDEYFFCVNRFLFCGTKIT